MQSLPQTFEIKFQKKLYIMKSHNYDVFLLHKTPLHKNERN